jgi:glycosyltransferase involved in cell wall biosynthesis
MFVSDEDRRTALRLGIVTDARRATTIYNGVDLNRFRPHPETRAAGRRMVAGIVARIVREKGYVEFLEMAFALLRANQPVNFLIVGDSLETDRDRFGSELRARIRASEFAGRFMVTGFTADVEKYLQTMDIFVLPSYREGFPRSVLEAMACGLPVVTTDIRGCREAVVDGTTGLIVRPRDAPALTAAVSHLLDHPDLARKMGDAGRRRAAELFDTEAVEKRFVHVFDSLFAREQNRNVEEADRAAAAPLSNYVHRAG